MSISKIPVFGAEPYGFKATDVTGCKAWFDAADVSTLYSQLPVEGMLGFSDYTTANEQRVTVWEDKSDGGNDLIRNVNPENLIDTSAIYMGPPIVAPDSYALPLATVNFPQTDSGGSNSNAPSFLQQNLVAVGGYSNNESARGPRVGTGLSATTDIFVVVQPKYLTVAGDVFSIGTRTTQGTQDFTCLSITSSGYWKINSQAGARDVTSDTAEVLNTFSNIRGPDPNYRILHMSLSNNNYVLRRNGSQIGSANRTWSPTLSNYRYYMARRNASDTPGNYFDGRIGEVIVYNSILTTEKRTIVESYLAGKWNLIDLLPLDHPAKLKNIPFYLGGRSMAEEPNGFVRRAVLIKIRTPPPPLLNAPTISFGAINIGWTSPANIFDIIIQQSSDDVSFADYLTFINQLLETPTFSYNLITGSEYGKYYKFRIRAKSGSLISAYATSVSIYVPYIPAVPGSLDTDSAPNLFQMQWVDVGGIGYGTPTNYSIQIYTYFEDAYTLIETILTDDTTSYEYPIVITATYTFKVAGRNAIGQSAYSDYGTNRSIEYVPQT